VLGRLKFEVRKKEIRRDAKNSSFLEGLKFNIFPISCTFHILCLHNTNFKFQTRS